MIELSLTDIAAIVDGQLVGESVHITDVTTDTRAIEAGALFIALVGERFDAHDFAKQAVDKGAAALIVERELDVSVAQIVVADSKRALGQLGAEVHKRCQTKTLLSREVVAKPQLKK